MATVKSQTLAFIRSRACRGPSAMQAEDEEEVEEDQDEELRCNMRRTEDPPTRLESSQHPTSDRHSSRSLQLTWLQSADLEATQWRSHQDSKCG